MKMSSVRRPYFHDLNWIQYSVLSVGVRQERVLTLRAAISIVTCIKHLPTLFLCELRISDNDGASSNSAHSEYKAGTEEW
jgi:hypothetical protein